MSGRSYIYAFLIALISYTFAKNKINVVSPYYSCTHWNVKAGKLKCKLGN